jgi:ketosteroid isomerase-like protein
MSISRRNLAAAAVLASGAAAFATAAAFAQDESAKVAEAIAELTKAMLNADEAKLKALTSDQLSYGHSAGRIENKSEFITPIATKKAVYKSIVLSNHSIAVSGNNAIARHSWESESGTGDGKWNVSKIGVLQVWVKDGGTWKLFARQAFKV